MFIIHKKATFVNTNDEKSWAEHGRPMVAPTGGQLKIEIVVQDRVSQKEAQ